ncbi:MAG TPA: hypothetical protein VGA52_10105 [Anaerolineales bacterium]|jgi:hypothetical protein
MNLTDIHSRLAIAMLIFSAVAGIWGLVIYFRRGSIGGNYWGILASGELLFVAQALLGVVMYLQGDRPGRTIHLLYGAVAALTVPAVFALTGGRDDRRSALTYGLVMLFLFGISLRAMGTGA